MPPSDILKKGAKTPFCSYYLAAGAVCALTTNFKPVLDAADASFPRITPLHRKVDFHLRFWIDEADASRAPWPKPHFRGLGDMIFAVLDPTSSLLVDLRAKRSIGRFSRAMANDSVYWRRVIFPFLLTVFGARVQITELHCACVAHEGKGLLMAGETGSGKSTLALALAQNGFTFLSDDRTYLSRREGRMLTWGLAAGLKLRPEAKSYFPELRTLNAGLMLDGTRAFELDPEGQLNLQRAFCCKPHWLVFLEQQAGDKFDLRPMSPASAVERFVADLLADIPEAIEIQVEAIKNLVGCGCWLLRYGGNPHTVARALAQFCDNKRG